MDARLPLRAGPGRAQFYTHALPVLDQFSDCQNFPGGKTKTTLQKLHAARLPLFDPTLDLAPLKVPKLSVYCVTSVIDIAGLAPTKPA